MEDDKVRKSQYDFGLKSINCRKRKGGQFVIRLISDRKDKEYIVVAEKNEKSETKLVQVEKVENRFAHFLKGCSNWSSTVYESKVLPKIIPYTI